MSFPIPEPYVWDESFKVFYDNLDEEHKGLFVGIFECCGDRGSQAKFDNLYKLVDAHFKDEEGMMESAKYSDRVNHKKAHDEFLAKLKGLSLPLDDGAVNYAKNWLVQHIKGIDFKYKKQL